MRFHIDETFWALFPEARIATVVVHGIDNSPSRQAAAASLMYAAAGEAAAKLGGEDIASHPAVAPWRNAYRRFGVKPSKYRSSIESLLRSALKQQVRSINPLVDIYNSVSLKYFLPAGGEDLEGVRGDVCLTRAVGVESFIPLGSRDEDPPQPGEVVYRDDHGVLCRCWNWREAERTKLSASTTDAFLCIEALPPTEERKLREACEELAALVRRELGGTASIETLDISNPATELYLR